MASSTCTSRWLTRMWYLRLCLGVVSFAAICDGKVWKGSVRLSARRPWAPVTTFAYDTGSADVSRLLFNAIALLSLCNLQRQASCSKFAISQAGGQPTGFVLETTSHSYLTCDCSSYPYFLGNSRHDGTRRIFKPAV